MMSLIERLEKASGPDRELDALIECELRRCQAYALGLDDKLRAHWKPIGANGEVIDDQGITRYHSLLYTFSLDAAMTLVPSEYKVDVQRTNSDGYACVWGFAGNRSVRAATPALALCIAAIKAREEMRCG